MMKVLHFMSCRTSTVQFTFLEPVFLRPGVILFYHLFPVSSSIKTNIFVFIFGICPIHHCD